MKKLFTRFAVEPTFYFDLSTLTFPSFWKDQLGLDGFLNTASNHLENLFEEKVVRKKHSWLTTAHEDGDALEIPSPIYSDKKRFIKDYERLTSFLKTKYQFIPSSIVEIETEGGCHFNLSIPKEIYESSRASQFFNNLQAYLTNHPSIIWSFLAPTDDQSSVIPFSNEPRYNCKGEFFTIRDTDGNDLWLMYEGTTRWDGTPRDYGEDVTINKKNNRVFRSYKHARRLELRFFMQPKTTADMILEIDFGLHLLNWIWLQTVRGAIWKQTNTRSSLKEYTEKKAVREILKACHEIDFPYSRLLDNGKIENLRTKFEYLPKYLV